MRTLLLAAVITSALLLPLFLWDRPQRSPASSLVADERPDRVLAATHGYDFWGCPQGKLCDINRLKVTVVVGPEALRVLINGDLMQAIARDGHEWELLRAALRPLDLDPEYSDLLIALDDAAAYEDLLEALLFARACGFPPSVAQPRA
jgi:hypothetical protein